MTRVLLSSPDLALYTAPRDSRVTIPHLVSAERTRPRDRALVTFDGNTLPVEFRGAPATTLAELPRVYAVTCRYGYNEHREMANLLDLLDLAYQAADSRLLFRHNAFLVPGLNPAEVVTAGEPQEKHLGAQAWDVSFDLTVVKANR